MEKILKRIAKSMLFLFAGIGFVLCFGYIAVRFGLTKTKGTIDVQTKKFIEPELAKKEVYTPFPLAHTEEWIAFRQAVTKDKALLEKVSKETGVSERLLISILVPEQMRLFYTERPLFKSVFEPLKVLGSQSQFSWGIFGIKDDTARDIENHLLDKTSPFYLGTSFEKTLSFTTNDTDEERFQRIINEHNHFYSYLYTALYVRQIESQWKKAGFSIINRPEIIATLWNVGFEKSKPKKDPSSGGSTLVINNTTFSFGELAKLFYDSDEMIELFPKK
ncbi:MAG: hypothetical protein KBC41_04120 [Candidatus Pacebacteria bacterium]|nr:hypothetical protein [Candidatus Paceibacterota bacterium]MBP9867229.1 hypothetical protein [Candidatus Paceibacterota bacterium]